MVLNDVIEIRAVIEEYLDYNLNIKTAYKFTKFLQNTENDYRFFVDTTQKIIDKYAVKDENNQIIKNEQGIAVEETKIELAQKELSDLASIDIAIDDYFYFNLEEFEGLKMSCRKMRPFMPFIIE